VSIHIPLPATATTPPKMQVASIVQAATFHLLQIGDNFLLFYAVHPIQLRLPMLGNKHNIIISKMLGA